MLTKKQIDNRCRKLNALKDERKEIERKIAEIEDELKDLLSDSENIETEHFKVFYTTYISIRFDSKALKASNERLYNKFAKSVETRRFSVSEK